ncbi:hypothetical protein PR202_gn00839 [Eleusine coracana subsp. coracana]|uniref:Agenet domain-containing protein n=1 Tax=Eleusine coracana subsp. coracana TaxID=191504 RepID=A0AAV5G7D2_ELECO|nr:hypothetical protein PR202_gn00839 [Eleusine coracana subsp. coracana]
MDSKYRFPPSSFVEVFYEGSWWPGVILDVLDDKFVKKYVVKMSSHETAMDDVERVDMLTVGHTHLRSRFDWHDRKWVRCLTEKQFNRGPQSTSSKRTISSVIQSSNDIDNSAASASYIDSDEITDESGSSIKNKRNNADAVLEAVCPDLSMCNENFQIKQKLSSYPEETGKQQNSVLALSSPPVLPSRLSVSGFGHLKYDPKHFVSNQHQLPCPRMISMPSVPQTRQLQASLFGTFGQLRPLPQGPVLGIQSLNPDFVSTGGSKKAFTVQVKQPTDKGYYLMAGPQQKNNAGSSVGTFLYRKRKECISSEMPVEPGENPEIVLTKKRVVDKNDEGTTQNLTSFEDQLKSKNDYDKNLPCDAADHSKILSEIDTMASIGSTPLKGSKGSQQRSVFLRESSVVDEIIPSGIPIGTDEIHHGGYIGVPQVGATKVSILSEHAIHSVIPLVKPCEANELISYSLTHQHRNTATETEISEISSMEQEAIEEFCEQVLVVSNDSVDLLPSAKSCEVTRHDHQLHQDNAAAMVQLDMSCGVPTDNVSNMVVAMSSYVAPNLLPSGENCEANKKFDVGVADCHGNGMELPSIMPETIKQSSSKKSAANEHTVPHPDCSSPMVEFAADKSALTELSSTDMNNSTESEHGNRLIDPKDAEGTPMSKYVPSRVRDCCRPLSQSITQSVVSQKINCAVEISRLKAEACELKHLYLSAEERCQGVTAPCVMVTFVAVRKSSSRSLVRAGEYLLVAEHVLSAECSKVISILVTELEGRALESTVFRSNVERDARGYPMGSCGSFRKF